MNSQEIYRQAINSERLVLIIRRLVIVIVLLLLLGWRLLLMSAVGLKRAVTIWTVLCGI
jgi:hypothetical protein